MEDKSNTKPKLKPARKYVSQKMEEARAKMQDITSSVNSTAYGSECLSQQEGPQEQESADVVVPDYSQQEQQLLPVAEAPMVPGEMAEATLGSLSVKQFTLSLETLLNTLLDNRLDAKQKALEEKTKAAEAAGIELVTPENALVKCVEFINLIKGDFNMYREQKNAIAKEQEQTLATVNSQADTAKRLETVIGRIEKVQGVKAPIRPPFPLWACLAYLFWHWPMYAFAYLWLSKYFRRFCFLITFFVILIQTCYIVLLASDNRTMRYEHAKYVTARNWLYVTGDTAATNKFNHLDLLFEDVDFNEKKIINLNDHIRELHEKMMRGQL